MKKGEKFLKDLFFINTDVIGYILARGDLKSCFDYVMVSTSCKSGIGKAILIEYYSVGMSAPEIANLHGVKVSSVHTYRKRMLKRLYHEFSELFLVGYDRYVNSVRTDDDLSVVCLGLSTRACNALLRGGYKTVGDLRKARVSDLLKVRNIGEIVIKEIKEIVPDIIEDCSYDIRYSDGFFEVTKLEDCWLITCLKPKNNIKVCFDFLPKDSDRRYALGYARALGHYEGWY